MKRITLLLTICFLSNFAVAQQPEGKVVIENLYSNNLENSDGNNPTRRVSVYLPAGYDESNQNYPVIYYLHGFTQSDSLSYVGYDIKNQLDKAIAIGKIRPIIFVIPDQKTKDGGSFYKNSSLKGNWATFTSRDLVKLIDENYRTIPDRDNRGITGFSMGGFGALKLGMQYPEVFGAVYSLSGGGGFLEGVFGVHGNAWRIISNLQSLEELQSFNEYFTDEFYAKVLVAMARSISPNPSNPPFYADFPYTYVNNQLSVNFDVLKVWEENFPLGMVDKYIENVKKLNALKIDWGRNDEVDNVIITSKLFSKKLERLGINHYAEEFIGTHGNKLWTDDGRVLNDMLPFFDRYLEFE
ncbi:alpha/beta hydrolase [Cyclobacterium salsum]|uniref:alpha/beta hydrolase n=1 Tax=Cyclobacterium salsum TaxID=2666329 RepID=UPI0013913313|nr:alpha/beta hydrolase-fold protein [Cyclobacterium salsum]